MNPLNHVAVIPDGNRRWAKKRGKPSFFGHREGAKTAEKIIRLVFDLKIPYFTFWGCSLSNITKRPKLEVNSLFKSFEKYFKKLGKEKLVYQNDVKINAFGRWKELFPQKIKQGIEEELKKTENHGGQQLTFLLAYSGINEMVEAIKKISELTLRRGSGWKIDEQLIKNNLWTKDLPPVDLIIRTGSQSNWSHNSDGFMMWEAANAQLCFTETLWPDFSEKEFREIIEKYGKIERRLGK